MDLLKNHPRMQPDGTMPVKSVDTSAKIVEGLRRLDGAGVTELADELDIAKSTVHDHLETLVTLGFVVKRDGGYHIGLRYLDIGGWARQRMPLYDIARPEIAELASQTGELANLVVEEHGNVVYLATEKGENAVNIDTYVGKREYLHSTAVGKAILAHTPMDRIDQIIDTHDMAAETPNTITDRTELDEQLEAIRSRGVAFDLEENSKGLKCVASPVVGPEDDVLGAVSVSGPTTRFQGEWFDERLPELVKQISNVIEINVTYS